MSVCSKLMGVMLVTPVWDTSVQTIPVSLSVSMRFLVQPLRLPRKKLTFGSTPMDTFVSKDSRPEVQYGWFWAKMGDYSLPGLPSVRVTIKPGVWVRPRHIKAITQTLIALPDTIKPLLTHDLHLVLSKDTEKEPSNGAFEESKDGLTPSQVFLYPGSYEKPRFTLLHELGHKLKDEYLGFLLPEPLQKMLTEAIEQGQREYLKSNWHLRDESIPLVLEGKPLPNHEVLTPKWVKELSYILRSTEVISELLVTGITSQFAPELVVSKARKAQQPARYRAIPYFKEAYKVFREIVTHPALPADLLKLRQHTQAQLKAVYPYFERDYLPLIQQGVVKETDDHVKCIKALLGHSRCYNEAEANLMTYYAAHWFTDAVKKRQQVT